jgi:LysM repeat protein
MPSLKAQGRSRGYDRAVPAALFALGGILLTSSASAAQTLKGSSASLDRQNLEAEQHDFTFLRTSSQVKTFVELGLLVQIRPNADFELHEVSFPYARPGVEVFVERLAAQYHDACDEKMVVTSLTRPLNSQPANASDRSVHPTGMAVDLRRTNNSRCRAWIEGVLLQLEDAGVLEATRESRPPHYHIVLFPKEYSSYVDRLVVRTASARTEAVTPSAPTEPVSARMEPPALGAEAAAETDQAQEIAAEDQGPAAPEETPSTYRVRRGDSLWTIAQKLGTTVAKLRAENELRSNRIYAGQVIVVPGR